MRQNSTVIALLLSVIFCLAAQPLFAQQPDLIAVKTNNTGGMGTVGTPFTWSIQVSNVGAAEYFIQATFDIFRDELPNSNISYGTPSVVTTAGVSGSFICSINASFRLNCFTQTIVTMAPGSSFTVSFTATPAVAGVFDNPRAGQICRADPGNEDAESDETNNDCSDSVAVTTGAAGPDLTVVKNNSVGGTTEVADGAFNWTLGVANGGSADATFSSGQTILSDNLPNADMSYGTPSVGSQTGISGAGTISCSIVTSNLSCIASGGSVTLASATGGFTVTVPATPTASGTFANPRAGGACSADPNNNITEGDETNNSCSDSVTVNDSPDLIAVKTNDTGGNATVGMPFTWSIQVSNIGAAQYFIQATFDIFRDELPNANMTYGTPSVVTSGVTGSFNCSINASFRLNCFTTSIVTIAPGGSFTVSFTATPTAAATFDNPRAGQICRADPGNEDREINESNNDCSDTVVAGTGVVGPDLTIVKNNTVGGVTEVASGVFNWLLNAANGGNMDATYTSGQTILSDNLPNTSIAYGTPTVSGLTDISGAGSISCSIASSDLSCIASGGSVTLAATSGGFTVTVPATPATAATFANPRAGGTCAIDPGNNITEGDETNNTCADSVVVNPSPDLTAVKTNDTGGITNVGSPFTWSSQVTNIGAGNYFIGATFNIFTDDLPNTNMTYGTPMVVTSGVTGTFNCTINGAFRLNCFTTTNVTVAPGGSFTVSVTATPTAAGSFMNPRPGGICAADPGNEDVETNEGNNSCLDTVSVNSADVSITKDDGVVTAVPGQTTLNYTIVAANNGPSPDPAVSVTDMFPAELSCTFTSAAAGGATGNTAAGSGNLADTLNMPVGSMVTYMAACMIDSGATGTLSNTAIISGSLPDPVPGNNSATDNNTVLMPEADISVTKTDGVTSAVPGQTTLIYTIVVSNNGPSDDPAVSISDTFPTDLACTYTSVAAGGASGNTVAASGDLADTLNMPAGSSVTYTASCTISETATGTLSNTATAVASVTDPVPGNNSATDNDTVLMAEADISVTKDDGVTSAVPGQTTLTYTIAVSNNGPSADPAVSLTDTFPADLTCNYTSVAAGGASGNTAAGAGDLADTLDMPSGSSVTYTASCDIDEAATGTLSNTVTATASVNDPVPGNNSAIDNDTVLMPEADISVSKDDGVTTAVPGQTTLTYTIAVSNAGPSTDPAVSLSDTFPADLSCTYTSVAAGGASGNTAAGSGDLADTLDMPSSSSVTYTASCDIDSGATGTLSNTVTATASVTDPAPGNNSATDDDTVLMPEADLSITKMDSADPVAGGDNLVYTITVDNAGPSDATNVVVTDNLPADVTLVSTAGCAEDPSGVPTCTLGVVLSGGSASYTISVDVDLTFAGMLSNTATVSTDTTDPNAANDSATEATTVNAAVSDLVLTVTDDAIPPIFIGSTFDVILGVTNDGPNNNAGVVVNAELSGGLTFISSGAGTRGTACAMASGSMITFDVGDLAAGETVSCPFTVEASLSGSQSITASAVGIVGDPVTANNTDIIDTIIVEIIDVPTLNQWGLLLMLLATLYLAWRQISFARTRPVRRMPR